MYRNNSLRLSKSFNITLARAVNLLVIASMLLTSFGGAVRTVWAANNASTMEMNTPTTDLFTSLFINNGSQRPQTTLTPEPVEIEQTPTPTQSFVPIETEPVATPTNVPPVTPGLTPTPLPTSTPSPEVTFVVAPSATPIFTSTATPTGTQETGQVTLTLESDEMYFKPGHLVTMTWAISGWENLTDRLGFETLEIVFFATPGLTPVGTIGEETDNGLLYRVPVSAEQGSLVWRVSLEAEGSSTITGELRLSERLLAFASLVLQQEDVFVVPSSGGEVVALDGYVKVIFPPSAWAEGNGEAMVVRIRRPKAGAAPYYLNGDAFEIVAEGETNHTNVNQFSQQVTVILNYDDGRLQGAEGSLKLYYFEPETGSWHPMPGWVDTEKNLLSSMIDEAGEYDTDIQGWQAARLPSLNESQVSPYTGGAAYAVPIQVPPGPAGLQPSVMLSYNSQSADGASSKSQASWVGMGWSLEVGSIERNMNGTDWFEGDDTYSINVNGIGGMLLPVAETGLPADVTAYTTTDQKFWRIWYHWGQDNSSGYLTDQSWWEVWDKEGNKYVFGHGNWGPFYPDYTFSWLGCQINMLRRWSWPLMKIESREGKSIQYTYQSETKETEFCAGMPVSDRTTHEMAIYPDTIIYPNERYQIRFERDTTTRKDWDNAWLDNISSVLFKRSLLSKIWIKHDSDDNGSYEQVIRSYEFNYEYDKVFPGVKWSANNNNGNATPALISITEKSFDGSALPATTFVYNADGTLETARNGYGGEAIFDYGTWNEDYDIANDPNRSDGIGECDLYSPFTVNQTYYFDELNPAHCTNINSFASNFKPGGVYKLRILANWIQIEPDPGRAQLLAPMNGGADRFKVGIDTGVGIIWGNETQMDYNQIEEFFFELPSNATQARPVYSCWKASDPGNPHACGIQTFHMGLMLTRNQVTTKSLDDLNFITLDPSYIVYRYDGSATNDVVHSEAIATTEKYNRYNTAYGEYRGNAMVEARGPDGRTTYTFFYQDDERGGNVSTSIVASQDYLQAFEHEDWGYYDSQWDYNGTQPAFERLEGDLAAVITNTLSDWNTAFYRSAATVSNGQAIIVQFRVTSTDASAQTILALNSSSPDYRRWGIKVVGSTISLHQCMDTSQNCDNATAGTSILSGISPNRWYVLMMAVEKTENLDSDNHFLIRVWERDNPQNTGRYETNLSGWNGRAWRFMTKANHNTLWLDEYSEGRIYSFNSSTYSHQDYHPSVLPCKDTDGDGDCDMDYADLKISWTHLDIENALTFEGDATGTQEKCKSYSYSEARQGNAQYGNVTDSYEAVWWELFPGHSACFPYRISVVEYYPYINNASGSERYLVGLPGISKIYRCISGEEPCLQQDNDLLSSQWFLYDNHINYDVPPSDGRLTGQRTQLRFAGANYTDPRFSDVAFGYDSWGNRTTVTAYTGEGTATSLWQGTPQTSLTCYGSGAAVGGYPCTDDGYHTYPLWQRNALGHQVTIDFSSVANPGTAASGYTLSVPVSVTDPNGATTSSEYDVFGRITAIRRPGDLFSWELPTLSFSYHDTSIPFYTEASQKLAQEETLTMRKYYNGLGQLLQTQLVGAVVTDGTCDDSAHNPDWCDIFMDYSYDAYGRVKFQSVPYADAMGGLFHTQEFTTTTVTSYDILGRPSRVDAPDGSHTENTFGDLFVKTRDAAGNETTTWMDIWGRVVKVQAPTGPDVVYGYNDLDLLVSVLRAGATTSISYDMAGRKTAMTDPDMGTWSYSYNALGSLIGQTDANGKYTCLYYDGLSRLTGKAFVNSPASCPQGPTDAIYNYDSTTGGNKGIGRQTGMSNASGSSSWTYDERGRLTTEIKVINSAGTFKTQWAYSSADKVISVTYPGDNNGNLGEVVAYAYNHQMLLDSVTGASGYSYVKETIYDEAGRMDWRKLGVNGGDALLQTDYEYFEWDDPNGLGRLKQITSGLRGSTSSLQDLRYYNTTTGTSFYDAVGNILQIDDFKAGSLPASPQTQVFHYDTLNRLIDAQASGGASGAGDYAFEHYIFDADGRLSQKGTMGQEGVYTFDSTHKNAVRRVIEASSPSDPRSNLTIRAYSTNCGTGTPGATMELWVNGVIQRTWTNIASGWTDYTQNIALTGKDVIEVTFTNDCSAGGYDRNLYIDYLIINGQTIQAEGGAAVIDWGAGSAAFDGLNVSVGQQTVYTNGALRFAVGAGAFTGGYDANGNMTSRVVDGMGIILTYDSENHLTKVEKSGAVLAEFNYDANGSRNVAKQNGEVTTFAGGIFELVTRVIDEFEYTDSPLNHGWGIYTGSGTVSTVYDPTRAERVMRTTTSQGTNFGIRYPASGALNIPHKQLSVWIKDTNNFYFYVQVRATNGSDYYVRYDPVSGAPYSIGNYAVIPVGTQYKNGTWQLLRRDLDADLRSVFGIGVSYVKLFIIRGDFDLDDLQLFTETKYYFAGGQRVVMRQGTASGATNLNWLFSDHLGSTSITADSSGVKIAELRYKPWGEVRYNSGATPTNYTYTGQYSYTGDFGLMYYNARWYDPMLGRFAQADSFVLEPLYTQAWDRYAYVYNNPLIYIDPTGYFTEDELAKLFGFANRDEMNKAEWIIKLRSDTTLWNALIDAQIGDIIAWEIGGTWYYAMFVNDEYDNIVLWSLNENDKRIYYVTNANWETLFTYTNWAIIRDKENDGKYTSIGGTFAPPEYTLPEGWWDGGAQGQVYKNPEVNGLKVLVDLGIVVGGAGVLVFTLVDPEPITKAQAAVIAFGLLGTIVGVIDSAYNIAEGGWINGYNYVFYPYKQPEPMECFATCPLMP